MSDAKRIVQAIAMLVRASYIDELPSDGDRNQWRAGGHAARHDVDSLRAALAAAESRAQRTEGREKELDTQLQNTQVDYGFLEVRADTAEARVTALEGALEKIGERACEINGWETACDYKCCDIAKAALAAPERLRTMSERTTKPTTPEERGTIQADYEAMGSRLQVSPNGGRAI